MNEKRVPDRLYKYRAFSSQTVDMLVDDRLFFADPRSFNDPLDTKPSLNLDVDVAGLQHILDQLIEHRFTAEMDAAAKTMRIRGQKITDHIAWHSRWEAERRIAEVSYNATDPSYEVDDPEKLILKYEVEEELLRRYGKGIFSLAESADCPLMWSHYGDQHKGLCAGYSVPVDAIVGLHKIEYSGDRLIEASSVAAMLSGDEAARRKVDEAIFLRKARQWQYEREWRLIGERGLHNSILELEEVVFGMRCPHNVKYAIVKSLEDRERGVKFYEMCERDGSFTLHMNPVNVDELLASGPRRNRAIYEWFKPIKDEPSACDVPDK